MATKYLIVPSRPGPPRFMPDRIVEVRMLPRQSGLSDRAVHCWVQRLQKSEYEIRYDRPEPRPEAVHRKNVFETRVGALVELRARAERDLRHTQACIDRLNALLSTEDATPTPVEAR